MGEENKLINKILNKMYLYKRLKYYAWLKTYLIQIFNNI